MHIMLCKNPYAQYVMQKPNQHNAMAGLLCGSAPEQLCPGVSANHCALPYLPILIIVVVTSVRIVILRIVFVIMLILTIVLFCPRLVKIIFTFPDELDKVFFYKGSHPGGKVMFF